MALALTMGRRSMKRIRVSDHAVLRWLERAEGLDVEKVRRKIRRLAYNAAEKGANAVKIGGVHIVLDRYGDVTTVLAAEMVPFKREANS
jgi:hypothetical protein